MPLVSKTFADIITFARSTNATYYNAAGLLTLASAGTPRFDYNPATLAAQGLLIEEQRVNLLAYSDYFDNAAWAKGNATVSANVVASPTGNLDADALIENTAVSAFHYLNQAVTKAAANVQYAFSFFVKDKGRQVVINIFNGANGVVGRFNPATGLVTSAATAFGTGWTAGTLTATALLDGWYRVVMTATSDTTTEAGVQTALHNGTTTTYTGDGVSGIYLYGAQLEAGSFATSYAPSVNTFTSRASTGSFFDATGTLQSAATNVARNTYNPANLAAQPFLLLEEARTNLLLRSAEFSNAYWLLTRATITADTTTAPDGASAADKLVEDSTAASTHYVYANNVTVAASTTHTFSVFIKAAGRTFAAIEITDGTGTDGARVGINLTTGTIGSPFAIGAGTNFSAAITNINNGWYRVSITAQFGAATTCDCIIFTATSLITSGVPLTNGDGTSGLFLWGAQLEAGAFPTSYIPTTTIALTRAADVASVNTLSPWYNASEGTLYAEGTVFGLESVNRSLANITDGTSNNRISIFRQSDAQPVTQVIAGGTSQFVTGFGANWTTTAIRKLALAYKAADYATCLNGGTVFAQASGTVPTVTTLWLGSLNGAAQFQCGYLSRLTYYPRRLSNAELQSITT